MSRHGRRRFWRLSLTLLCLALCWATAAAGEPSPRQDSPEDLTWLRQDVREGAVVYAGGGRVYLVEIADGRVQELGAGSAPKFSPSGSRLAWIRGTDAVGRQRRGDGEVRRIRSGVDPQSGVHWISDDEVVVRLAEGGWRRVSLTGAERPVPELDALGVHGRETDVRRGPDGVWSIAAGDQWATTDGRRGRIPGDCAPSLTPDGRSVGGLQADHLEYRFVAIRPGGAEGSLRWVYSIPRPNKGFDNHQFSSNDPRFVVAEDEKHRQPVVMKIGQTRAARLGRPPAQLGEIRGDFTVGNGKGAPWPAPTQP